MKNIYILVAAEAERINGATAPSREVAATRLNFSYWPLHERTRFRKNMKVGDIVLIYCGGQKSGGKTIIASATISDRIGVKNGTQIPEEEFFLTGNAYDCLNLINILYFVEPIDFLSVLPRLSFCPANMSKWGIVLHGGARKITESDYLIITDNRL